MAKILKISQLSPLWAGCGPSFEQTWIPFSQECSVPSLVDIGPVVLEKILKSCQFIFIISQLSTLWEGRGPSIEQTWIPFTQVYFVLSLVEIGLMVLEKKMKMWKVYRQMTDDRWSEKFTWAFNSGELKTQNRSLKRRHRHSFYISYHQ